MKYFDLLTAHQTLLEIHRRLPADHDPDDRMNTFILLCELERQRHEAFAALPK